MSGLVPSLIIPMAPVTTSATPTMGTLQPYNASAGPLAPVLSALATLPRDGAEVILEKDGADTTTNAVTVTCASGDTFANGANTLTLTIPGQRVELQAATIANTRVWKVMRPIVPPVEPYVFSYGGTLAVSTGTNRQYLDGAFSLLTVRASVGTAPTGSSVIADVKKNNVSIYTIASNRPTITASGFTDLGDAAATTTFVTGDYLTVDILQVGSTTPGSDLNVTVRLRRTG